MVRRVPVSGLDTNARLVIQERVASAQIQVSILLRMTSVHEKEINQSAEIFEYHTKSGLDRYGHNFHGERCHGANPK